jgi:hypothetical protein
MGVGHWPLAQSAAWVDIVAGSKFRDRFLQIEAIRQCDGRFVRLSEFKDWSIPRRPARSPRWQTRACKPGDHKGHLYGGQFGGRR